MAKSKSSKEGSSSETQTDRTSGAKGRQSQNHDPALASLFALSVSKVQMQPTRS